MEQNSKSNRLHALDGLRGIAILMVFLSHINATFISRTTLLGGFVFNSGVIGVSFLFILSGFLMAYLYPQPASKLAFIQKRYTRIFPLFLTVCSSLFILRLILATQWYITVGIFLLIALFSHVLWVYVIKRYVKPKYTRILFFTFIAFQIVIGIYYFLVMHHPAVYYYQQMPALTRSITNWLVNAALVLPIGRYVTMLDPVYWSLAAEVLFYLLYPFICAPIIAHMSSKSKGSKIILLLCLLPLFGGIALLSEHVLYLSLLRFQLFYYFVTGMTLGYLYRKNPESIAKIGKLFPGILSYATLIIFFGVILAARILEIGNQWHLLWMQLFLAWPFTGLLAIALSEKTALAKFFRSRILVYIGTVSYSLYLSHMFILNLAITLTKQPDSLFTTSLYIFFTLLAAILFSSLLYFLLERPYFKRKESEKRPKFAAYTHNKHIPFVLGGITLAILVVTFIVYQSTLNFFTLREPLNGGVISPAGKNQIISLRQYPTITLQFNAKYNNFGVMSLHLIHESIQHEKFIPQTIIFRIKEKEARQWYATSQYTINSTSDVLPVSYGFPLIANAQDKIYIVSLSEKVPSSSEYILLDNGNNAIADIFFVDKKTLIKNPQQLLAFLENKLITVLDDTEAQQILALSLPFFIFTIYIFLAKKKK